MRKKAEKINKKVVEEDSKDTNSKGEKTKLLVWNYLTKAKLIRNKLQL